MHKYLVKTIIPRKIQLENSNLEIPWEYWNLNIFFLQSVRVWPGLVNQRMGSDRGRPGLAFLSSPRQQHVQDVQVSEEQSWDVSWSSQPRQLEQPS